MSAKGKLDISRAVVAVVIGVLLIAIACVLVFHSRAAAKNGGSSAGQANVPIAVQQQDRQFISAIQSMPAGQRPAYIGQNRDQWDEFMMSATPAQKTQLAKAMAAH